MQPASCTHWNGQVDSVWGWTLPKICIIWENVSNKSCWALNSVQTALAIL